MNQLSIQIRIVIFALLCSALACNLPSQAQSTEIPAATATEVPVESELSETQNPTATAVPTEPTPQPTEIQSEERDLRQFGVILVTEDDVLNVRSGAGVENEIVDMFEPRAIGITQTGNQERVGDSLWVEVNLAGGGTGWVNSRFLTRQVSEDIFCNEPAVRELLQNFVLAVRDEDGDAMQELVSPKTGLLVRLAWWNSEVAFLEPGVRGNIIEQERSHDWGVQSGSGAPLIGSFSERALPDLHDVLDGDFSRNCNTLEHGVASGNTAGLVIWPFEYTNVNYIALFREAAPGDEFNWRTWAVGIEYLRGEPFIAMLVQYQWEP